MPEYSSNKLKIALADDQELFLESLVALFAGSHDRFEVIWTARSGEEAIEKAKNEVPDVILMDYFFKDKTLDGAAAAEQLLQLHPDVKILILSVSCEMAVIRESLQRGATGYCSKESNKAELLRAIETVAAGGYFLEQTALREIIGSIIKKSPKSILTRRETDVAQLYGKGRQIKEIGVTLFISEDTVESHIKNIRAKTGAASRYDVAEYLRKLGIWEE
jgi:two-component system, NarL family, response regulator NreC